MWTAKIHQIIKEGTVAKVNFLFTSPEGKEILISDRGFQTDEEIKRFAFNQIKAYQNMDSITVKDDDYLDLSEFTPKVIPPTEEELAKQAYDKKRSELIALKQDLDLGLIQQTDYAALLTDTQTAKTSLSTTISPATITI